MLISDTKSFNKVMISTILCTSSKKDKHIVEERIFNNQSRHGYCATCHSCQGASIGDRINIHEWTMKLIARQWLWTAVARCRDFRQVYVYLDDGQLAEIKQSFLAN